MKYSIKEIAQILHIQPSALGDDKATVSYLLTDSRSLTFPDETLFFAKPAVKIAGVVLAVLLVVVLLWKLIFGRRRYRYGRRVGFSRRESYRGRRRR